MKRKLFDIGLYFIIDGMYTKKFEYYTDMAVHNHVSIIQYRDKDAAIPDMIENSKKMKAITKNTSTTLIINDILEVAEKSDADGIHVGQSDDHYTSVKNHFPDKIIGVSTMTLEESLEAQNLGADYLGVGPVFVTQTKPDTPPPIGLKRLKEIVEFTNIPIVAIGGINKDNLVSVLETGVHGVAIISAILTALNPEKEIQAIQQIIAHYNEKRGKHE